MKPTFGQVFAFSLVGLIVILALLFQLVSSSSRETITRSSERIRNQASSVISERITQFLNEAPETTWQFQREVEQGLLDPHDGHSVEPALISLLLADSDLGELTFTYGEELGFDASGDVKLAPEPRGQWSVIRLGEDRERCRHVYQEHGVFVADRRDLGAKTAFASVPWMREAGGDLPDPTTHLTFTTPARQDFHGRPLWSDLHWSQLDADLPEAQRRVEVSVQQAITDADGRFIGVLRAGLLARHLDEKIRPANQANGQHDPHLTFICDEDGRLITGLTPADPLREEGEDLRIAPEGLPPEIRAAVHSAALKEAVKSETSVSGTFKVNGKEYIATFRALPRPQTQDWVIGIVVPRAFYFGQLAAMRERLLAVLLAVMILLVICGGLILQGVRRAQAQITHESLKMNAFDFTPTPPNSPFRDVIDVLESQEKAKAAMRAMSKYVPIDLVRRLYRDKSEPVLGAVPLEVTIMFTDIKDFTALCERLKPNELADALGRYLEVMAGIIQRECHGTIDKFIGDAIMTFWNAPEPVADHARMACRAALLCREAGARLAQSPDWGAWPPFGTRFGLHCAPALIGHFGARDRMNYTAIGDAVNLASRLEGLNKQYGTSIIVSETVVHHCGDAFVFRLLDRVAVKGKSEAIRIFELLGVNGEAGELRDTVGAYEKAFAAYSTRDFAGAIDILSGQQSDPPSAALLGRCRGYLQEPPPEGWDGVYVSKTK